MALIMVELYARRSLTRSGFHNATTLVNVLKHTAQSSIEVIFFLEVTFSDFNNASKTVVLALKGAAPADRYIPLAKSSQPSCKGMGGDMEPTDTAFLDEGRSASRVFKGVVRETVSSPLSTRFCSIVLNPVRASAPGIPLMLSLVDPD